MGNNATGLALRTLRIAAGLSLREAADKAGASVSYLSRAETGDVTPKPTWIAGVVEALGARLAEKDAA